MSLEVVILSAQNLLVVRMEGVVWGGGAGTQGPAVSLVQVPRQPRHQSVR